MVLSSLDWFTILAYFCVALGIGFYFARKEKTSKDYFLGGRNVSWFAIGGSIFAANIGSEHLIGLAGAGAVGGLSIGMFELMAIPCLMILCWVFIPYYINSGVFTMPEFLERRFNSQCRYILSTISLGAYIFTKISVGLFAGGILIKAVLGWPILYSAIVLVLITGIYSIAGGLSAVIYNNVIEATILIVGTVVLSIIGLFEVGGFAVLQETLGPGHFDMIKPMTDPQYPWTGTIFGILVLGIWYWCTDQVIVQRTLAAKNIAHARGATLMASFLKILPLFIFIMPGLIAGVLWPDVIAEDADMAFPTMVIRLMPKGMAGLMIAALLAALMSSLSSVFNSCSTLITMDFYQKFNPLASEKKLVFVGRFSTGIIIVLSIMWIPMIGQLSDQMYLYMQSVQAYIGAPITAVFLIGILWRGATGAGAIATLIFGIGMGACRFIMDILMKSFNLTAESFGPLRVLLGYGENAFMASFLNYCVVVFVLCIIVMVTVSYMTRPKVKEPVQTENLTFSLSTMSKGLDRRTVTVQVILSLIVMGITIGLIAYFA